MFRRGTRPGEDCFQEFDNGAGGTRAPTGGGADLRDENNGDAEAGGRANDGAALRQGSRKRKPTEKAGGTSLRRGGADLAEAGRFVDSEDFFYAGDNILVDEDTVVRGNEYDRLKRLEQLAAGKGKRSSEQRKRRKIARHEVVKIRVAAARHPDPELFKTTTDEKIYARVDGKWEDLWDTSMAVRRQVAELNGLDISGLSDGEIGFAIRELGTKMFFWSHGIKI